MKRLIRVYAHKPDHDTIRQLIASHGAELAETKRDLPTGYEWLTISFESESRSDAKHRARAIARLLLDSSMSLMVVRATSVGESMYHTAPELWQP